MAEPHTTSNSGKKIAVFPAAGALGTSVYTNLAKLFPANQLVLVSRHPEKTVKDVVDAGAETRYADYKQPQSLKGVFAGVSYLFLVSYPSIEIENRFEAHKAAISAALEDNSDLEHVFYTSLAFAKRDSPASSAHVMQAHLHTEAWLRQITEEHSSLAFTAIREGIYSESYPMYTGFCDKNSTEDEVVLPHDGKPPGIAWVSIADLGEANAKLVYEFVDRRPEEYVNKIVLLSGPRAWSLTETVSVLARTFGRQLSVREGSFEDYSKSAKVIEALDSHGPGEVATQWTTVFQAIRDGETAVVTGDLERLLGRTAEGFEAAVKRMLQQA